MPSISSTELQGFTERILFRQSQRAGEKVITTFLDYYYKFFLFFERTARPLIAVRRKNENKGINF